MDENKEKARLRRAQRAALMNGAQGKIFTVTYQDYQKPEVLRTDLNSLEPQFDRKGAGSILHFRDQRRVVYRSEPCIRYSFERLQRTNEQWDIFGTDLKL